jgi:hypothetical protein
MSLQTRPLHLLVSQLESEQNHQCLRVLTRIPRIVETPADEVLDLVGLA